MKKRWLSAILALVLVGAMAAPARAVEGQSVHVDLPALLDVYVEGTPMAFLVDAEGKYPLFSCDGTAYMPLYTAGLWLGADTVWDESARTVTITSHGAAPVYHTTATLAHVPFMWGNEYGSQYDIDKAKGVEAQLRPDVTVTVDGREQSICPLLLRGHIYLPIQGVAQLLGKEMLRYGGDLYLYQAPTEEGLAQAAASLSAIHDHLSAVRAIVAGDAPNTGEEFSAKAKEVQSRLIAAYELPTPAFQAVRYEWEELRAWLEWTLTKLVDGYLPPEESSGVAEAHGMEPARPMFLSSPHTVQEKWDSFSGNIVPAPGYDSYFLYAERQCAKADGLLAAIGQSPARSPSDGETPQPLPVAETIPASGTAYAATQPVLVDGKTVEFPCHALKDDKGNLTNYVKLRDLAHALNGTAGQFNAFWDKAVHIENKVPYTPNGTEMSTPFSGDRAYRLATEPTYLENMAVDLTAIVLTDDQGGAYTYYMLRDLGSALGFHVGWSAEQGVFIETE